ncbi:MAG: preprotein translocase subunit YajC [Actinobacteria bacterium RBG_16_64_13]|nr:MAG: preprotein translocase subunit YajC [Actinobacteria bacterium RBG_16_64_13]
MSSYYLIIYVVAFIGIFYFMAIRPQQRQRRAHAALLSSLKKGDTIVTAAGIYGKVKRVDDNLVVIEVAKGVNMKIARRAVAEIIREGAEARAVAPEGTATTRGRRGSTEIEEATADEFGVEAGDEADEDSTK